MQKELEEAFKRLQSWSDSLPTVVKNSLQEARQTLETGKMPANCPSKESFAKSVLQQIGERLTEVNAAYSEIYNSI